MAAGDDVDLSFLEDDDARQNPSTGQSASDASFSRVVDDLENLDFEEDNADGEETVATEEDPEKDGDTVSASFDWSLLPDHACAYCGIHDSSCVMQDVKSGKWFCNARGQMPGSHIVNHLVRSGSREVRLHSDSHLGGDVLECYSCSKKNVFLLGFVPAQGDSVVMLLCREPCLHQKGLDDLRWDVGSWQPLIVERQFLPWLLSVPSNKEVARTRQITLAQAAKLEEMWKKNPQATLEDAEKPASDADQLPRAESRYDDAYHYQRVIGNLIKVESENDKRVKKEQTRTNLQVRWDVGGVSKKRVVYFVCDMKVMYGDELLIKHDSTKWECIGSVKGHTANEEIALELRTGKSSSKAPTDKFNNFTVEFVWRATSFERMFAAMRAFAQSETSVSGYLFHRILGHEVAEQVMSANKIPQVLNAPNLPDLNRSQATAVRSVLGSPLSVIQGPPGTGKTVTSATIVYHLAKASKGQVLVCAPSNIAVDQLAEKIALTGLKVVRVVAKSRESLPSTSVEHLTLHYQVRHLDDRDESEMNKLMRLRDELGDLSERDDRRLRTLRKGVERELLSAAEVICTTCVTAGDPRLNSFRFRSVLIDEATQSTEPEALIPIVHGCKQLVFVGDQCQLGPVITDKRAAAAGLGYSMFERLVSLGERPIRLEVQYRMHPALSEFPSNTFYEGSLQNGVSADDRTAAKDEFPWIDPSNPMMFWALQGTEEVSASGTSFLNRIEAQAIEQAVTHLLRNNVHPQRIGVITPYEGQRAYALSHFSRAGSLSQDLYREIEVASVDSFQGREKDYIIMSCVRSSENQGIGFLADPRRLNVALTRSRLGNIIVGNPNVLSRQRLWATLLCHYKDAGVLVDGPLTGLKSSHISIPRPKRRAKGEFARLTPLPPVDNSRGTASGNGSQERSSTLRSNANGHTRMDTAPLNPIPKTGVPNGPGFIGDGRPNLSPVVGGHLLGGSPVPLPHMPFGVMGSIFSAPPPPPIAQVSSHLSPFSVTADVKNGTGVSAASVDAARARGDFVRGGDPRDDFSYHHTPGWK